MRTIGCGLTAWGKHPVKSAIFDKSDKLYSRVDPLSTKTGEDFAWTEENAGRDCKGAFSLFQINSIYPRHLITKYLTQH